MSTLGVPPMRSSVQNEKPLRLRSVPGHGDEHPLPRPASRGARSRNGSVPRAHVGHLGQLGIAQCRAILGLDLDRHTAQVPQVGAVSDPSSPAGAAGFRNSEPNELRCELTCSEARGAPARSRRRASPDGGSGDQGVGPEQHPQLGHQTGARRRRRSPSGRRRIWRSPRWRNTCDSPGCSLSSALQVVEQVLAEPGGSEVDAQRRGAVARWARSARSCDGHELGLVVAPVDPGLDG